MRLALSVVIFCSLVFFSVTLCTTGRVRRPSSAMASLLDSEAHFDKCASEAGLSASSIALLHASGFKTLAQLAYMIGQPGVPTPEANFQAFVQAHFSSFTIGHVASLRRLIFESQTMVIAHLRLQVHDPDRAAKVPEAERDRRLANLRLSLSGVLIEGHTEPSRSLLDLSVQMEASNQVKYIAPEKCTSRLFELGQGKTSSRQIELEANKLVVREQQDSTEAPMFTAMQVHEALRRRGLALAFAGVMSWNCHEKYLAKLFAHLHREPPPGYLRTTVAQIVEADKLAWHKLIEDNTKPRKSTAGTLALDTALASALESYHTSFSLLPLPKTGKRKGGKGVPDEESPPGKFHKGSGKNPTKLAAKEKGRKGKGKSRVPYAILQRGGAAETPSGERICFDFSLSECKNGETCAKGKHVCCICYGPHAMKNHPQ